MESEACAARVEQIVFPLTDWDEYLGFSAGAEHSEVKVGGDHTDDRVTSAVQSHTFAHNVGRGRELALPQAFTDQGDGAGADLVFSRREIAAEQRLDS